MSVRGWAPGKEVLDPRGMWSAVAQRRAGVPARASYAQNVRFAPGIVRTRPGANLVTAASPINGLIVKGLNIRNLGTPSGGWRYLYLLGTQLRLGVPNDSAIVSANTFDYYVPNLPDFPAIPLYHDVSIPPPYTISVATFNSLVYIAVSDKDGNGLAPCLISDGDRIVDVAFSSRTGYTSGLLLGGGFGTTFTSLGAGYCSPGTATYAMVLQTGTGFLTRPMVQTAPNFASASKIQATFNIPAGYSIYGSGTVYLLKNRIDNPNQWYWIPNDPISGSVGEVPYTGGPATLTFTVNISDADMAASLDSANDQWDVVQQVQYPTLTGPFLPSFVVLYGKRMCYGVGSNLYVSDINNPQSLALDRNLVQSPKQLKLGYAFPLQGSTDLYLTGSKWLGRVTDNGDIPATWAPPILISETIGAPFPGCVCYRTAGNYAFLATDSGIYLFNGTLGDKPITYLVQDQWARVNWNAAYAIEMVDDIADRILYVAVPLDGATEVNAVFVIDYTYGLSAEQVDISLDLYSSNGVYSLALGPDASGVNRLWLGSDRGHLLQLSATHTADAGGPITSIWESGLVRSPGDFSSRMVRVGGMDLWMRGGGGLTTIIYGPDKARAISPPLLSAAGMMAALSAAPGIQYAHKFDFSKIENYSIRFQVSTWFELSGFTVYSRPDLFNR